MESMPATHLCACTRTGGLRAVVLSTHHSWRGHESTLGACHRGQMRYRVTSRPVHWTQTDPTVAKHTSGSRFEKHTISVGSGNMPSAFCV